MKDYKKHLIDQNASVNDAFQKLNILASNAILFLIDDNSKLLGSLTDGDLRRGFIQNKNFKTKLIDFIQKNPKKILKNKFLVSEIVKSRNEGFKVIPIVNNDDIIIDILNLRNYKSYLPVHAFIMAGGKGKRLRPLTLSKPKPLLEIGSKPIIEHNIDRLIKYGIKNIDISVKYLGDQIKNYFKNGSSKSISISYINEIKPLGTIGSLKNCKIFYNDDILVLNSDLLTTINYEELYLFYKKNNADLVVAGVPYLINIPYGVIESNNLAIISIKEKPTYTYYSNAGIYLFKKEIIDLIPNDTFFNATDLIDKLISLGKTVMQYQMTEYWLDIGKVEDFKKAQNDIKNIDELK